jgi:hypothetical protein
MCCAILSTVLLMTLTVQVRLCREKTSKNVYAMKKLKKSEMLRRGQVPFMFFLHCFTFSISVLHVIL